MAETHEFMRPKLVGPRFDGHEIPLDVLRDLAALQDLVVEVAKWQFLEDHQERSRSPRGFTDDIQLTLTGLTAGCVELAIGLCVSEATLPGTVPQNVEYFGKARDRIVDAIGAAGQDQPIIGHLPSRALGYFNQIGRSLRDDEAIEFAPANGRPAVRLTTQARRRLVLASAEEYSGEVEIRGVVPEADQRKMSFQVQTRGDGLLTVPFPTQHADTVKAAFNGYRGGVRVRLQGIGRRDARDRLVGIDEVEHIELLHPLDVPAQLDELRNLADGWLDGRGNAPAPAGLDWLARASDEHFPEQTPLPHIYPTPEGGVQLEWSLDPWEAALEVDLTRRQAEWHALDLSTDEDEERSLDLTTTDDWQWLTQRLGQMAGPDA